MNDRPSNDNFRSYLQQRREELEALLNGPLSKAEADKLSAELSWLKQREEAAEFQKLLNVKARPLTKEEIDSMEQIRQQKPTATAVELRALAPIQQLVADLVADMLVNGSHRKIIDQLLTAAIRHQFWRRWPEDVEEQFPDLFNKPPVLLNDWRDDLHAVWRETRKAPATEKPAPSTAADRIRFSIIETLRGQFDDFLTEGTPEEWWTMWDMLVTHHSTNLGSDNANEFPLAGAFEAALGEIRHIWIKVPESLRKRVLTYVECLEEAQIDDEEEAA